MSTNIVPILVPTGELSDSFVVGMLRLFQSTGNQFSGDLLARHAPKTTENFVKYIRTNAPIFRVQSRVERAYAREMLPFTKGLMVALMDETIGLSTAWGRTQPQLSESVNTYMERNSMNWRTDGTGSPEQREFYDELMDPFLQKLNSYWDRKISTHPNLMWYGTLTPQGDLLIEADIDYRLADPDVLRKKVEASGFLDESYGQAVSACNAQYINHHRAISALEREFNIQPAQDERLRAHQIAALSQMLVERYRKIKVPQNWKAPEAPAPVSEPGRVMNGVVAMMVAKDDIVDDSEKPDPSKSSVPEVPLTQAEIIARNPLAIIRAQNVLTEHEAEQRLRRELDSILPPTSRAPKQVKTTKVGN